MMEKLIEGYRPWNEQERGDKRLMLKYIRENGDILLRSNETFHFTASAWVTDESHTKILMLYHNIYNSWSWPGGHADGEEDLLKVALREVREETGIENLKAVDEQPLSLEILTVNAHFKKGKYVAPHLHLNLTYLIEASDADSLKIKPDENSALKWFDMDEAVAASTEPDMRVVYEKLNQKLRELY